MYSTAHRPWPDLPNPSSPARKSSGDPATISKCYVSNSVQRLVLPHPKPGPMQYSLARNLVRYSTQLSCSPSLQHQHQRYTVRRMNSPFSLKNLTPRAEQPSFHGVPPLPPPKVTLCSYAARGPSGGTCEDLFHGPRCMMHNQTAGAGLPQRTCPTANPPRGTRILINGPPVAKHFLSRYLDGLQEERG